MRILASIIITAFVFVACGKAMQHLPRQWQHTLATWKTTYIAPTASCDVPDVLDDEYTVWLHKLCTLEQHKKDVGSTVDLDSAIQRVFNETERSGLGYYATLSVAALAAVRGDISVDVVVCNTYIEPH